MRTSINEVHVKLASRYLNMLHNAASGESIPEELDVDNLRWMSERIIAKSQVMPDDKVGRWIGWIQAGCVLRGLTTSRAEREFSRALFHAAYAAEGLPIPETADRETDQ